MPNAKKRPDATDELQDSDLQNLAEQIAAGHSIAPPGLTLDQRQTLIQLVRTINIQSLRDFIAQRIAEAIAKELRQKHDQEENQL
jgi:hypothetical protein